MGYPEFEGKRIPGSDPPFNSSMHLTDLLGYLEFNYLAERSLAVITDSGGTTEETTVMGVPCMTLSDSTERPETITIGTNELLGTNPDAIAPAMKKLLANQWTLKYIVSVNYNQ